ncbi:zinc ribbon domain-containing protein [Mycoplana rhizolycopersici]|uniref:UPF0547 domain-containing protein n=1 Tax=Mycoplana rhizolycopersici TaxID=2746702 RepID=A0ABX2QK42_9HYPH|nr:hypothetical protein [Rhizobium rhizolycopersici]
MIFLIIWILFGVAAGVVASSKGRSGFGWFLLGCIFGVFALIIVACLSSLKRERVVAATPTPQLAQPIKACPECAETVLLAANVCKHCGHRFDAQVQAV